MLHIPRPPSIGSSSTGASSEVITYFPFEKEKRMEQKCWTMSVCYSDDVQSMLAV